MLVEDLQKVILEDTLPTNVADLYLKIYVSDIDWKPYIAQLWTNSKNKMKEEDLARAHTKKVISCTTLIPSYNKGIIPDPPQNLLFWTQTWSQFSERDWLDLYKKNIESDIKIKENRKKILSYGIVDAIDYFPLTRQAFNWLYMKAQDSGDLNDENKQDVIKKFQNLVKIYGGAAICNVFSKHEANVSKVLNWRSGYFIEKEIHKIYSLDQLAKIKQTEMSKIDPKYIIKNSQIKASKK